MAASQQADAREAARCLHACLAARHCILNLYDDDVMRGRSQACSICRTKLKFECSDADMSVGKAQNMHWLSLPCGHVFHTKCLNASIEAVKARVASNMGPMLTHEPEPTPCPLCRTPFDTRRISQVTSRGQPMPDKVVQVRGARAPACPMEAALPRLAVLPRLPEQGAVAVAAAVVTVAVRKVPDGDDDDGHNIHGALPSLAPLQAALRTAFNSDDVHVDLLEPYRGTARAVAAWSAASVPTGAQAALSRCVDRIVRQDAAADAAGLDISVIYMEDATRINEYLAKQHGDCTRMRRRTLEAFKLQTRCCVCWHALRFNSSCKGARWEFFQTMLPCMHVAHTSCINHAISTSGGEPCSRPKCPKCDRDLLPAQLVPRVTSHVPGPSEGVFFVGGMGM